MVFTNLKEQLLNCQTLPWTAALATPHGTGAKWPNTSAPSYIPTTVSREPGFLGLPNHWLTYDVVARSCELGTTQS